jgi:aryl-alcohol dehydrogenase-like predicted oxidoreductase
VQSEYSLWHRPPERDILPALEELGVGFVPFSLLGKGFLTGKVSATTSFAASDIRGRIPRFQPEAMQANRRALVGVLEQLGAQRGATPAQPALAWLLVQKPCISPIPGSCKPERPEENNAAVNLKQTSEDPLEIEAAVATIEIQGARYLIEIERMTGL